MDAVKKFKINSAINLLCEGSKKVDYVTISIENGVVRGIFEKDNKVSEAEIAVEEIYDIIEKNEVKDNEIKDFILMNILKNRMREKVINKTVEEVQPYMELLKALLK